MKIRIFPRTYLFHFSALGAISFALLSSVAVAMAADNAPSPGETAARGSDCFSCHSIDQKLVGPSFTAVAQKYAGQPGAERTLQDAIKNGHVGTWGQIPMPPHPQLSDTQRQQMVAWILSLKGQKSTESAAPAAHTYTTTVNGKEVTTSFPIFQPSTQKVTASVFRGYELFDSYCFRCHGADAVGGEYAPNLRASLNNGMTEDQFVTTAMVGVKDKGMPAWAGFFSPEEIKAIYQYTKARAIGALGTGTPPQ
jgi:cytochrome c